MWQLNRAWSPRRRFLFFPVLYRLLGCGDIHKDTNACAHLAWHYDFVFAHDSITVCFAAAMYEKPSAWHFFFFLMLFKRENNRVQLLAGVRKLSLHCRCAREQSNERQALPAPRWTNVSVKYASIKWICRSAGSRKGTDGAVRCNKIVAAGLSTRECGPYRTDAGTNSCAARAQSPFWLHPLDASGRTPRNQGEILPTKVSYTGDAHT